MNKIQFKTRKEVSTFLKEKNIYTTNWNEEKWQSINYSKAEIHMQALAEAMWDAHNESEPRLLKAGEWHIPFGDQMDTDALHDYGIVELNNSYDLEELKVAVAVARCARLSYMTFEGKIDYKKDIELFKILYKNKHMSPFEHVAKAMSDFEYSVFAKNTAVYNKNSWTPVPGLTNVDEAWCNNIRGFVQYRFFLENGE
jgi:thymidylate synthase ThyX